MKLLKLTMLSLFSMSILSCGSDDDGGSGFELNNETLVGSYSLEELEGEEVRTIEDSGSVTTLSNIDSEGSIFSTTIVLLADGTFTAIGTYVLSTETNSNGNSIDNEEVITLNDSGNYVLDVENETITFNSVNDEFDGIYTIESVTESDLELRIIERTVNEISIVSDTDFSYTFTR